MRTDPARVALQEEVKAAVEEALGEYSISLRDKFAAAALQGMCADPDVCPNEDTAVCAYEIADWMMAARKPKTEAP
jgi:hypothetical protein